MNRWLRHIVMGVCVLVGLSACRAKLHDPITDTYVQVNFTLESGVKVPEGFPQENPLFAEKITGRRPATLRLLFYNVETMELEAEEFLPAEGGFVVVEPGTYNVFIYGMGTESSQISGIDYLNTTYVTTSATGMRVSMAGINTKGATDYDIFHEPDHLFAYKQENFVVTRHSASGAPLLIDANMKSLVKTYSLRLSNVEEIERIAKVEVIVTGQTPGFYVWDGRYPENRRSAVSAPCLVDRERNTISTIFNSFGRLPGEPVFAYLLITDYQGHTFQIIYDITDIIEDPSNPIIEIDDPITIPDTEGGFTQEVDEWDVEIIPVPL